MNNALIKCLIVDDEAPARNRLRSLLNEIDQKLEVSEAKNGIEALNLVQETAFNVIFLDIRMPGMDGLECAQHFNKLANPPAIIFTTAFDAYALQAFDCHAIDYLLKPIRSERLKVALEKAQPLFPQQLTALNPLIKDHHHISIYDRGRILLIPIEEVVYLRAELKYITVRTLTKEYILEESLTHLENMFGARFIRCHRNCIVARQYVSGFEKRIIEGTPTQKESIEKHWVVIIKNLNEVVPISRRHQHIIQKFTTT